MLNVSVELTEHFYCDVVVVKAAAVLLPLPLFKKYRCSHMSGRKRYELCTRKK